MIETLVFVLGLLFGSFYNVVIYRLPLEKNIATGRSMCPNCQHTLTALELIPVISIIIQGFKCKNCQQKISPRYLIVELLTASLWLLAYLLLQDKGWAYVLSAIFLISMCIIVGYIDFDTQLISDSVLFVFLLGRAVMIFFTGERIIPLLLSMLTGVIIYGLIYVLAKWYYKQEAFGMGDVFYIAAIGAWFTPIQTVLVAIGSFFVAGILLAVLGLFKRFKMKQEIPFGPAMSIMAVLTYFWGQTLIEIYMKWAGLN